MMQIRPIIHTCPASPMNLMDCVFFSWIFHTSVIHLDVELYSCKNKQKLQYSRVVNEYPVNRRTNRVSVSKISTRVLGKKKIYTQNVANIKIRSV